MEIHLVVLILLCVKKKLVNLFLSLVKYPKDDKEAKDIKYYDIQMIIANGNKSVYKDFDIYTFVNNKQILLDKVKRSKK